MWEIMKRIPAITLAIFAVLSAGLSSWSCSRGGYSGKVETITFGTLPSEAAGLIYVAQDRQFFADNGLSVVMKYYDTGVTVTDALLKGEVNIALCSEFPFLAKVLAKEKISGVGVADRFTYFYLFGRRDRGIDGIATLKRKRVGITRGTITDFYLGRFLELNGMTAQDVTLVDVAPPQIVDAISSGSVDAIVAWGAFALQIRAQLGTKIIEWQVQSGQASYGVISARNDWTNSHPEIINRFLISLSQAEKYLTLQPARAKAIVQKWMNYEDASMQTIWPEHQFSLSLDQSLIAAMEDEARWMIKNNLTREKEIPDFMKFIFMDGLEAVKPEAVNIIR